MQSIWLNSTMLFIGCSFDGIGDPDFSGLFAWAGKTFGSTTQKHYALVKDGDAKVENSKRLLFGGSRIQLVPYGPTPEVLPAFINKLNPNKEEAQKVRLARARELIGVGAYKSSLEQEMVDVVRPLLKPDGLAKFAAQAKIIMNTRMDRAEQNRNQLRLVQSYFASINFASKAMSISVKWSHMRSRYDRNMHEVALSVVGAFDVMPKSLLDRLCLQRGLIPETVRLGASQSEVTFFDWQLKNAKIPPKEIEDRYAKELIERLFRTYAVIRKLDVEKVFPLPAEATGKFSDLHGIFLVAAMGQKLVLIDNKNKRTVGHLELESKINDTFVLPYEGRNAIFILLDEQVLIWDPRRSNSPLWEIPLNEPEGSFYFVASLPDGDILIRMHGGKIGRISQMQPPLYSEIGSYWAMQWIGERLFALDQRHCLWEIDVQTWEKTLCFDRKSVLRRVIDVADEILLEPIGDIDQNRSVEARIDLFLQHPGLHAVEFGGREFMILSARVDLVYSGKTFLFLIDLDLKWVYSWIVDGRLLDVVSCEIDAVATLVASVLSEFDPGQDLLHWAQVVGDKFVTRKTSVRVSEDIYKLIVSEKHILAFDAAGGLSEVNFDGQSKRHKIKLEDGYAHCAVIDFGSA